MQAELIFKNNDEIEDGHLIVEINGQKYKDLNDGKLAVIHGDYDIMMSKRYKGKCFGNAHKSVYIRAGEQYLIEFIEPLRHHTDGIIEVTLLDEEEEDDEEEAEVKTSKWELLIFVIFIYILINALV